MHTQGGYFYLSVMFPAGLSLSTHRGQLPSSLQET